MNVTHFMKQYKPLAGRFKTMQAALNLFSKAYGEVMVETGTTRQANDWGAGMSTLVFGHYCQEFRGRLWTVDNNPTHMDICKEVTKEYKDKIEYVVSDSLVFLASFHRPIDLLYLDSVDCPINCTPDDPELLFAQNHQLKEITLAMPKLNENAIVLLDDNAFEHGGKTRLAKIYLKEEGWKEVLGGQQSLWVR